MNTNQAALSGSNKPFIEAQASPTPLETELPELGLKYLSLSDDKPAPQFIVDPINWTDS